MPRNSSGAYVLPAGNPVVPDTLIETSWANPTMSDIAGALTDSLDRYGRGGMLAEFKIADGLVTAPGLSFTSQANLGLYRPATSVLGIAGGGGDIARFSPSLIDLAKPTLIAGTLGVTGAITAGSSLTVTGALTAGSMDITGALSVGSLVVAGLSTLQDVSAEDVNITGLLSTENIDAADISCASIGTGPIIATAIAADTITTTGTIAGGSVSVNAALIGAGSAAAPSLAFSTDTDTGLFSGGAGVLSFTTNGVEKGNFDATGTLTLKRGMVLDSSPGATEIWMRSPVGQGAAVRIAAGGRDINVGSLDIVQDSGGTANIMNRVDAGMRFFTNGIERFRLNGGSSAANSTLFGSSVSLWLDRAAGAEVASLIGSVAGVKKWELYMAHSAGGQFILTRYNDAGAQLDNPLSVDRAVGIVVAPLGYAATPDYTFRLFEDASYRYLAYATASAWAWRFNRASGTLEWFGNSSVSLTMRTSDGVFVHHLGGGAYKPGGGVWADTSDSRIKQNIVSYTRGLADVMLLQPKRFNFRPETGRDTSKQYVGLIAQDVQPVMPELVSEFVLGPQADRSPGNFPGVTHESLLALDVSALTYALLNAVKELKELNDSLDFRVTNIEGVIN